MRIVIDRDRCTGLGMCEAEAPELFEVQDDGTLRILDDRPEQSCRVIAEAAVQACPTEALSLVED
jgi:ferredoxin